ncbi:thioredoxin family protein [Lysobacter sp. GX 14042]|uniref:thioredoxin family protein n=1 Tax=Lysobacter sp. GX 14042 TaxID=2907155 RepID=UPI001F44F19D|nr:thioredoxin family protein [Lysobacter sp. GX 14042]MCE7031233.1 thioredoxin family protein [Lysobacter sp. GX 14042]
MAYVPRYTADAPDREAVDAMEGPVVLEFGTDWCGHCQAAQPGVRAAMAAHDGVRHLKVEDGRGRRLGRSFGVKLWPTLVFMRDGTEVARLVRPTTARAVAGALESIDPAS